MGESEIPIETFDALLRDLVTWNLAVPGDGDDAQAWHLVARAQQRLGELTANRRALAGRAHCLSGPADVPTVAAASSPGCATAPTSAIPAGRSVSLTPRTSPPASPSARRPAGRDRHRQRTA